MSSRRGSKPAIAPYHDGVLTATFENILAQLSSGKLLPLVAVETPAAWGFQTGQVLKSFQCSQPRSHMLSVLCYRDNFRTRGTQQRDRAMQSDVRMKSLRPVSGLCSSTLSLPVAVRQ